MKFSEDRFGGHFWLYRLLYLSFSGEVVGLSKQLLVDACRGFIRF